LIIVATMRAAAETPASGLLHWRNWSQKCSPLDRHARQLRQLAWRGPDAGFGSSGASARRSALSAADEGTPHVQQDDVRARGSAGSRSIRRPAPDGSNPESYKDGGSAALSAKQAVASLLERWP
jgi:hypothetical protein